VNIARTLTCAGFFILLCYTYLVITVRWPSAIATRAEIWRVLDLSGITKSVRDSRNYLRAGFVYLNGQRITTQKETVEVGSLFRLELRFPNGIVDGREIFLSRPTLYKPRLNQPDTPYYKP
jgi:hypothetical protein